MGRSTYLIVLDSDIVDFALPTDSIRLIQHKLPLIKGEYVYDSILLVSHLPETVPIYIFLSSVEAGERVKNWLLCSPSTRPNLVIERNWVISVSNRQPGEMDNE